MAKSSSKAVDFFGIIQRLHCLFSASRTRWDIYNLAENTDDSKTQIDAKCLAESETYGIGGFEFLVGMVIWYEILVAINTVSKTLQSRDMDIDIAITQLKGLVSFFQKYRETGFEEAIAEAKKITVVMDIEPIFHVKWKRSIKKRTHFDEETRQDNGESVNLNEEEKFRIDYFINIMDQALASLQTRLDQFQEYEKTFGFLFDLRKLNSANDDSLKESCINLDNSLRHGVHSDIDGNDLFFEIKVFRETLPKDINKTAELLEFLKRLKDCYPHIWITMLSKYMDCLSNYAHNSCFSSLGRKKLLKTEVDKVLLTINDVIG